MFDPHTRTETQHQRHGVADETRVESLRRQARQLWNTEPACAPHLRTSLLSRLAHLEYELERIHYGNLEGRPAGALELEHLGAELAQLQAQWPSPVVAA